MINHTLSIWLGIPENSIKFPAWNSGSTLCKIQKLWGFALGPFKDGLHPSGKYHGETWNTNEPPLAQTTLLGMDTYPTYGRGKSSFQLLLKGDMFSSLKGSTYSHSSPLLQVLFQNVSFIGRLLRRWPMWRRGLAHHPEAGLYLREP